MGDAFLSAQLFKEDIEQSEVAKKLHCVYEALETEFPRWELRIINGSYDVTTYSVPSIVCQSKGSGNDSPSDEETPLPINKQELPSVVNGGCIYLLLQRLIYLVRTGKRAKLVEQRHSVLKDINLRFESGKMYLVLGAPGSGKVCACDSGVRL
jgi:ABC-type multidrug transport system fused ATPase/permease subunit